jgi:hypothetical protein
MNAMRDDTELESMPTEAHKQAFEKTLEERVRQGYQVESRGDTDAVLTIGRRRRWFGLFGGEGARFALTVGEDGRTKSRRVDAPA